jgi:CheY-like chemotaxis protein
MTQTILVVDDEFGLAEAVSALLSDEGFRVFTAVNGRMGLQRLAEANPDLILLDFMMPILDGAGVLEALRANETYRNVPVILMSGVAEPAVREFCDGYAAFLRKPFSAQGLLEQVNRLLAKTP